MPAVIEVGAASSCRAPAVRRRAGLRRLRPALPAMVGSAVLLSIAGSTQPAIGLAVMAGWLGVGVGLLARSGERLAWPSSDGDPENSRR